MSYQQFAYLYDRLMDDVPYDKWVELLLAAKQEYNIKSSNLLDLACGTGELSVRLAQKGFTVTGADISSDMLSVAQNKAEEHNLSLFFMEQDMSELEDLPLFDFIGIFCDSLNYLQTEEQVVNTFKGVYEHLDDGGLFIFDVHSLYKMNHLFHNQTYALNDEDVSLIWLCYEGEHPNSVEHDLSFFHLDESTQQYMRYDELHFQRTFSIEQYSKWLKSAGFSIQKVTADFQNGEIQENAERIFFYCLK